MSHAIKRTKEFSFDYTHEWEDEDNNYTQLVPLEVTCHYDPGFVGSYWEPPESPTIEILSILIKGTNIEYTVTESTQEKILAKAWEELESN